MHTFLIAHTNPNGLGVAQKAVTAKSTDGARAVFQSRYPQRTITVIAVQGVGA